MARRDINVNPAVKLFEAYSDFSGGMNTEISNERLADSEMLYLENVDLSSRGSLKKRAGFRRITTNDLNGVGQGMFFYFKDGGNNPPQFVIASGGKLYIQEYAGDTAKLASIKNTDGTDFGAFQTARPIDATQYKDTLYLATGTKLLTYKGEVDETGNPIVRVLEPYKPTPLEAIYIGTNALADNPDAYIQDRVAGQLAVLGIKPSKRSGVANEVTTFIAYIEKPETMTVEYKWEYKLQSASTFTLGKDFNVSNTWEFKPTTVGTYTIKVTVRDKAATTTTSEYEIPNYEILEVADKRDEIIDHTDIHTCTMIKLHWDRLLLARGDKYPEYLYMSDLNNPAYIPMTNALRFESGRNEAITALQRYRDMLVVFTRTTIQALFGKSPRDYERRLIHDGIGCVAPRSCRIVGNGITFLSEEGVQELRSVGQTQEYLNVKKLDGSVTSLIQPIENAIGAYYNNQYRLNFPDQNIIYRLYPQDEVWTHDKSSRLHFSSMKSYSGDFFYQDNQTGVLYQLDRSLTSDDGEVYKMVARTKWYDLGAEYNYKKLKKLYILAKHYTKTVNLYVTVYADAREALSVDKSYATVTEQGDTEWVSLQEPNFQFRAGTILGEWVLGVDPLGYTDMSVQMTNLQSGKCRRVQLTFEHRDDSPVEIFSFGILFKAKKP